MNEALTWALENSRAAGAERAVLFELAWRAEGCLTKCTARQIMGWARIERTLLYECLLALERLGELERMTRARFEPFREFHFTKLCDSPCHLPVDCGKRSSQVFGALRSMSADLILKNGPLSCGKISVEKWVRKSLFPAVVSEEAAKGVCEECGGEGWRMILYPNADGEMVRGAAPCGHLQARMAGRWGLAESEAEDEFRWMRTTQLAPPKSVGPQQIQLALKLKP